MNIRKKLQLNTIAALIVVFLVTLMLFIAILRIGTAFEELQIADEIQNGFFQRYALQHDYVTTETKRAEKQWFAEQEHVGKALKNASGKLIKDEDKSVMNDLIRDHEEIAKLFAGIVENRQNNRSGAVSAQLAQEIENRQLTQLKIRFYRNILRIKDLRAAAKARVYSELKFTGGSIAFFIIIVSGISAIGSLTTGREITRRISKLREDTEIIGRGNLEYKINIGGNDEFADFSRSFNAMTEELRINYRNLQKEIMVRWEVEKALRQSEQKYRSLFDSMSEGFAVGNLLNDQNGKPFDYQFIEVNSAYERLTGISREEFLKKTILQLIPTLEPQWIENHAGVVESGIPVRWESFNEHTGKTYEIFSYRPEPGLFASVFTDITERKQVEIEREKLLAKIAAERHRLDTILRHLPSGVMIAENPHGRIIYANKYIEQLFGPYPCDGMERYIENWRPLHTDDSPFHFEEIPMVRALRGLTTPAQEMRFRKNGTDGWIDVQVNGIPFFDAKGDVVEGIITVIDISARKRAEEALHQLNETLEQRVTERTELARTRSMQLQALAVELIEAEEQERRRIAQILHDDLQQILAAGKMQLQVACAELPRNAFLTKVEEALIEAIRQSRQLSHELCPPVLHHGSLVVGLKWLADQMHKQFGLHVELQAENEHRFESTSMKVFMFRAVQELLFNTVKHAGVKSAVVHLSEDKHKLAITVSDSGKGFDPRILETVNAATGLGLLSLRERASHIGGNLVIESAPSQGSRFILTLPLRASHAHKRVVPGAPLSSDSTAIRVLFADDHKVIRQGLIRLISGQPGIQVVGEANNGNEALELSRKLRPDLVVMDVSMPGMDGVECTTRIKEELPDVCVLGLSISDEDQRMRLAGADAFIPKTASSSELVKAIYSIMRHKQKIPEKAK